MINVTIVGGSGYSGGELLRLLSFHPEVSIGQVTSERLAGRFVHSVHPNLRGVTRLKFVSIDELVPCDVLFLCLPHGSAVERIEAMKALAPK
ncbi:MAG: N-acetyl-gamma-glutamyl-phosphate reductase, partial [Caldilinea sp.]|nr:N-acetyl-gamma-glutamyl-phosphate reductase [Caldilinea sp.]